MAETYNLDIMLRAKSEGLSAFASAAGGLKSVAQAGAETAVVLTVALATAMAESVKAPADFQTPMRILL